MPAPPPTATSAAPPMRMAASAGRRPTSSRCCAPRCADIEDPGMTDEGAHRAGAFFGRRKGKKLGAGQADLFETLLPRLRLDPRDAQALARPETLFGRPVDEVWLEI